MTQAGIPLNAIHVHPCCRGVAFSRVFTFLGSFLHYSISILLSYLITVYFCARQQGTKNERHNNTVLTSIQYDCTYTIFHMVYQIEYTTPLNLIKQCVLIMCISCLQIFISHRNVLNGDINTKKGKTVLQCILYEGLHQ